MHFKKSTSTWLFFLYALLVLSLPYYSKQAEPQPEASKNAQPTQNAQHIVPPYKEQLNMTEGETQFYRIDVSKFKNSRDLAVSLISFTEMAPNAFLSETREFPEDYSEKDFGASVAYEGGILFVPEAQLEGVEIAYLGLKCTLEECQADLSVDPTREFSMQADGKFHDKWPKNLGGGSTAVVRLHIPDDNSTGRIVINAEALPTKNEYEPYVQLYLNKGYDIPYSQKAQRTPKDTWDEGKTLAIYEGSKLFCRDCDYTLSIKFHEYSAVRIQASVFSDITEIWKKSFTDAVRANHWNKYSINTNGTLQSEDIAISINPHEGLPTIYWACDTMPIDLNDFRSKTELKKAEDLIISSEDAKSCKTQKIYVVVYGSESSSYSIKADVKGTERLQFGSDNPLTGDIFPGQEVIEEFVVSLDTLEKVKLQLETESNVNITIVNCRFPTDCPGLAITAKGSQEIRHPNIDPAIFNYTVIDNDKGKEVTIDLHNGGCYPILALETVGLIHPVCAYKVILTTTEQDKAQYSLTVDLEGHQSLLPGIPRMGTIFEGEKRYFMLSVPQVDAVEVSFQITVISGDVVLYVSRTEEFPAEGSSEAQFAFEGRLLFKEGNLTGIYYATVQAYQSSSFVVSATVLGAGGKTEDYAVELQEGVPQKGVLLLKHENPVLYYKMYVDLPDNWEGMIRIVTTPMRGTVIIVVNNDENKLPDTDQGKWDSNSNYVKIHSSDPEFIRKGVYHIGVFVDWSDVSAFTLEDITFTVAYGLSRQGPNPITDDSKHDTDETAVDANHMILTSHFPFHGRIREKETQNFKVFAHPNDTSLTIYKEDDAAGIDLFVSLDSKNKYPNVSNYDYSTRDNNRESITLNKRDIEKACENFKHIGRSKVGCEIYFSIIEDTAGMEDLMATPDKNNKADEIPFTLRLSKQAEAQNTTRKAVLPLEGGLEYDFHLPRDGEPALFYFYPFPGKDIHILAANAYESPEIYVNVQKYSVHSTKSSQLDHINRIPTTENHQFSSIANVNSQEEFSYVMIPGGEPISTVVTVAVYFDKISFIQIPEGNNSAVAETFSIVVSSDKRKLSSGKAYRDLVHEKEYNYYEINVRQDDCNLLIALTSFEGHADLVISSDSQVLPTLTVNDFASLSSLRAEIMEIGLSDIYPRESMRGTWIIGVYGRVKTSYSLTVVYEEQKMMAIKSGIPMELYLKPTTNVYLKYEHNNNKNFTIRLDKQSGSVITYINPVVKGKSIASNLPNNTFYTWRILPEYHSKISIGAGDQHFCVGCTYLIRIESVLASKLSISVFEDGSVFRIQNSLRYFNTLKPGKGEWFLFSATEAGDVSLNIDVAVGEVNVYASHSPSVNATNYIWSEKLSQSYPSKTLKMHNKDSNAKSGQKVALPGDDTAALPDNVYYLYIENPGTETANLSFIIESRNSSTVLVLDKSYHSNFEIDQTKSLLYYSPFMNEILFLTTLYCFESPLKRSKRPSDQTLPNSNFEAPNLLALGVQAKFWEQGVTAGAGANVKVTSDYTVDNLQEAQLNNSQRVCVMQTDRLTGHSKIGRYEIAVKNPYMYELSASIYIHTSESQMKILNKKEVYSGILKGKEVSIFDLSSSVKESWYFDVLVCSGSLKFSYANTLEGLQSRPAVTKELKAGEDFVYSSYSNAVETKYASLESTAGSDKEIQYILRSNHFNEDQAIPYNKIGTAPEIDYNYVYEKDKPSTLKINYQPVVWKAASGSEHVLYHVKVCPKGSFNEFEAYCGGGEGCKVSSFQSTAGSKGTITAQIASIDPGRYSIVVTGMISHRGSNVYSLIYPVKDVTLRIPKGGSFKRFIFGALAFICTATLIVLAYRKLRKGEIVKKILSTEKEGYGFFGEDEEQPGEIQSANKLKDEEKSPKEDGSEKDLEVDSGKNAAKTSEIDLRDTPNE